MIFSWGLLCRNISYARRRQYPETIFHNTDTSWKPPSFLYDTHSGREHTLWSPTFATRLVVSPGRGSAKPPFHGQIQTFSIPPPPFIFRVFAFLCIVIRSPTFQQMRPVFERALINRVYELSIAPDIAFGRSPAGSGRFLVVNLHRDCVHPTPADPKAIMWSAARWRLLSHF